MKAKTLLLSILILSLSDSYSQNFVKNFDGWADRIQFMGDVATGTRTIEMWFKPDITITDSLMSPSTLINSSSYLSNQFNLSFSPSSSSNPGTLKFTTYTSGPPFLYEITSDSNSWSANKWYHVAAVIHPSNGMMLFINGIKQISSNPHSAAPVATTGNLTTVATWGHRVGQSFDGSIDDVRLSSTALYTTNFIPSCPDLKSNSSTIALLNFNDSSNINVAIDSSSNNNNGSIQGAISMRDNVCPVVTAVITRKSNINSQFSIYPNPSSGEFTFQFNEFDTNYRLKVFSSKGQEIQNVIVMNDELTIDLSSFSKGIYFYTIIENDAIVQLGKLIKD